MVTIEQKLSLFSKLLNQEIKEETEKKIVELDKEYEAKIAESKYKSDKDAADIIDNARKRAEAKKIELISKGRMSSKKEEMLIKEKVVVRFIESLMERTRSFTDTPSYKAYLVKTIGELSELKDYENDIVVTMTEKDMKEHKDLVLENLAALGIKASQVTMKASEIDIIGGIVIADSILNMKVDMSMRTVIEESKERIVELVTMALREAGEIVE